MRHLALAVLLLSLEVIFLAHTASGAEDVRSGAVRVPSGITYATTAQNWSQSGVTTSLTAGSPGTLTLTNGPAGVDTSAGLSTFNGCYPRGTSVASGQCLYQIYISDGASSEAVTVTGGTCAIPGGNSCTITFIPYFNHPASTSYAVESASSGLQETWNVACLKPGMPNGGYSRQCNVTVPANGPGYPTGSLNVYRIYGTLYIRAQQSIFSGYGVYLDCMGRGACIQTGDLNNSNNFFDLTLAGFSFRVPNATSTNPSYAGVNITNTVITNDVATIATAAAHGFRAGDMVTILFTDNACYWGDAVVASVPTSTSFTVAHPKCAVKGSLASQATPGVVALAFVGILDNSFATHFIDLQIDRSGNLGSFNNFFDFWDDENATIDHFNNNAIALNASANWTGSFIFSGGAGNAANGRQQLAPVITLRDSSITANFSNCVTDYNSNGLYVENTVCQATGPWEVYSANSTGNYQGAYIKNIYSESSVTDNPVIPARSPFPGLGVSGLIAGASTGAASFQVDGVGGLSGGFPNGGTGSTPYTYYIVANDTTAGTHTSPMQILNWRSTGDDSIPVRWPRIANGTDTIIYDVLRMTTPGAVGSSYPSYGNCPGGSGGTCGSVVTSLSQSTACSGTLVCKYTDKGSSSTSAYTIQEANYDGLLTFWPGAIVAVDHSVTIGLDTGNSVGVGLAGNPLEVAYQCPDAGATSAGGFTTCLSSKTWVGNSVENQSATLLTDGPENYSPMTLSKGRLNFSTTPYIGIYPHHIITLIDSQPALTQATIGFRPPANANDVWIGTDVSARGIGLTSGQLAFGAPVSITNYIHASGDGVQANWLERLTSKEKTFAVPVKISEGSSFTLGDGSPLTEAKIYTTNNILAKQVPPQSCLDVVGEARGLSKSAQITSITPPGRLGNLSLNAYPSEQGEIILHFCNPSNSVVTTSPGIYSFLGVR